MIVIVIVILQNVEARFVKRVELKRHALVRYIYAATKLKTTIYIFGKKKIDLG